MIQQTQCDYKWPPMFVTKSYTYFAATTYCSLSARLFSSRSSKSFDHLI